MNGEKVKAMRLYLNKTQREFAAKLGVAASTICEIENNHRQISGLIHGRLTRIEMTLDDDFYIFANKLKGHTIPS